MSKTEEVVDVGAHLEGTKVVIGGAQYELITHGRQQAIQVAGITSWLAKNGSGLYAALQSRDEKKSESGLQVLLDLLGLLDADSMVSLFKAIVGCTTEEAELYFDAATLIEAGIVVYEKHPTVRQLLNRFFSTQDSESDVQPESSTISE